MDDNSKGKTKGEYLCLSEAMSVYGMPKRLIDKHLPSPRLKTNPHYRSGPPMKLYLKEDV